MSKNTGIAWTDHTYNPWMGCTKVSPGCAHCYMFREQTRYGNAPDLVRRSKTKFKEPLGWKEPARVFTCSWSDFFHEAADAWRDEAWAIIKATPHLTYQILTKRPERIAAHLPADWGDGWPNVWLGVSVENQRWTSRLDILVTIPAAKRFVSCEPLLGPVDISAWTGYNPVYGKVNIEDRDVRIPGGTVWRTGDPERRISLENQAAQGESVDGRGNDPTMLPAPDRRNVVRRVSAREGHARPEAGDNRSTPAGLPSLQGADSAGADSESREREQVGQSPEQLDLGDIQATGASCATGTRPQTEDAERSTERYGETDREGRAGDQATAIGRREAEVDSEGFRHLRPHCVEDCTRRSLGISWLIVGGESGPDARPMELEWARTLLDQCKATGVPYFLKQLGGYPDARAHDQAVLDGLCYTEMP